MEQPRAKFDVFLCHSSKDKHWADAACSVLEKQEIRCWVAPRDIMPSEEWGEAIIRGISLSRMVVVFSGNANDSRMVRREVERAMSRSMPMLPLRIENIAPTGALEFALSSTHWLDAFTPPVEEKLEELAQTVKAILGTNGSARTKAKTSKTPAQPPPRPPPPSNYAFSPRKNLVECYVDCWANYVTFSGRIGRREFWVFAIVNLILLFILVAIAVRMEPDLTGKGKEFFGSIFWMLVLPGVIPTVAACIRRLHDTGRGAASVLVAFIPGIGPLILAYRLGLQGDAATNKFGPNPACAAKPDTSYDDFA